MSVDIKFIAKKANVSIATVSRVINNSKNVSAELKKRVLAEVEKYEYKPNILARGLILNKSNLIGVMLPNVSDIYHAAMLRSIEMQAEEYGYNVIVSNIYSNFEKQKQSLQIFNERQIDGVILLHENTAQELKEIVAISRAPIVLASVNVKGSELPSVGIDDSAAAADAVAYLIRLGHRRIAGIFGDSYSLGTLRKAGFIKAMNDAKIDIDQKLFLQSDCTIRAGERAAQKIMQEKNLPTAIFCVTDEIAIGVMNSLRNHGYRVPEDISVFGFDNINLSIVVQPNLSTVSQPVDKIGQVSMQILADILNNEPPPNTHTILPHSLVIRESCRAIV